MRFALLFSLVFLNGLCLGQTNESGAPAPEPKPSSSSASGKPATSVKLSRSAQAAAELQKTVDQLTQSNRDLLDLLKQQQAVLEDMQFDRRLQSRQIQSLEERLEDAIVQKTLLQNKVDSLESAAAVRPVASEPPPVTTPPQDEPAAVKPSPTDAPPTPPAPTPADTTPPQPSTFLPPADTEGAPGTKSWHRLFTLKGDSAKQTDLFHVEGRTWRVVWHNQDPPNLKNTSGLFVDAFPKDDTIPQRVCAKMGTGGDATELDGPGNYYLKIDASGGAWELAVEDFR
jgi:hypothetical protein